MDSLSVARIVGILGLVAANAFFVAAEFALVASKHLPQEEPGEDSLRADPRIARARRSLERPISSAQVGITFSSLALGWLGVSWLAPAMHGTLDAAGVPLPSGVGITVGAVVSLLAIAALYLIYQ